MALGSDPYAVLGVPRDATDAQIGQARRRLSRRYHPDVNPAPEAVARFKEVQAAFELLSDPVARAEYDQVHEHPDRVRVVRDASGGYGLGGEASPGLFIQPTVVDFGLLTPKRRWADAKVTVAWTGEPPASITRDQGSGWWRTLGAEQPNSGCMVFHLRAVGQAGTPNGRQHAQFTVTVDDTVLTVRLAAEFEGEFPPDPRRNPEPSVPTSEFLPPVPVPGPGIPSWVFPWLLVIVFFIIVLIAIVKANVH